MSENSGPPPYHTLHSLPASSLGVQESGLHVKTFQPQLIDYHAITDRYEYEAFGILVERANGYLQVHPRSTVITCESVELAANGQNAENACHIFHGELPNVRMRGLRMWMRSTRREMEPISSPRIGYCDFLPELHKDLERVERLDSLITRINSALRKGTRRGRIVTVQTLPIKLGSKGPKPDATSWTERGTASRTFVNLVRIFYVIDQTRANLEEIGVKDFIPADLSLGSSKPVMETFPVVLEKAREWLLSLPPNYRPVNVQTIMFRWSFNKGIDSESMTYNENKDNLQYLRYIRVAYVVENEDQTPCRSLIQLHAQLFAPINATSSQSDLPVSYEKQSDICRRIKNWASSTHARIVSVETLQMRMETGGEKQSGFDAMHTWNKAQLSFTRATKVLSIDKTDETFCTVFRVYTDGNYPPDIPPTTGTS